MMTRLPRGFYARDTLTVARELLGKRLVRLDEGHRLAGIITEVEAYIGEDDRASHASPGPTARNAPMYGPPGYTYVYLIYGMHHCLNVVTERAGFPAAILIRAVEPVEGLTLIQQRRGPQHPLTNLTCGPGRVCAALGIDRSLNNHDLCAPDARLWIEDAAVIPEARIAQSPRIGVRGDQAALEAPWRFYILDSAWVSNKKISTVPRSVRG
ncbi:MAG TPA: DNA-3-methyladenine glycosylase [Anaerolineae bacterium]|nr:DNA-3-methyladenine glycosylase [Anaerolineae bacterium]HQK15105.1 DNA-3-methyladenine glycosylase [Anaerolineae bacterium]